MSSWYKVLSTIPKKLLSDSRENLAVLSAIRKRRVGGRLRVAGAGLNRDLTARCGMAHCFFVSFATALDRQFKPKDWVFHMPNLSAAHRAELKTLGVELIVGIPNDFLLSRRQSIIRDVRYARGQTGISWSKFFRRAGLLVSLINNNWLSEFPEGGGQRFGEGPAGVGFARCKKVLMRCPLVYPD